MEAPPRDRMNDLVASHSQAVGGSSAPADKRVVVEREEQVDAGVGDEPAEGHGGGYTVEDLSLQQDRCRQVDLTAKHPPLDAHKSRLGLLQCVATDHSSKPLGFVSAVVTSALFRLCPGTHGRELRLGDHLIPLGTLCPSLISIEQRNGHANTWADKGGAVLDADADADRDWRQDPGSLASELGLGSPQCLLCSHHI